MPSTWPSPRRRPPRGRRRWPVPVAGALLALVVWSGTTATVSGWTSTSIANSADDTAAASVQFTHSAGTGCSLGPRVSATATCAGSVTGSETITNNGTADGSDLTAQVSAASCAAVKFDNNSTSTNASARVLLARGSPDFQAAGPWSSTTAITLGSSSYATAVTKQTETAPTGTNAHAVGVWFKAASGQAGPLMSFGTNPMATAGTDDQAIVLNANGTISFYWYSTTAVYTSTGTFNNNAWHFAYFRFAKSTNTVTFTVSVDSTAANGTTSNAAYPTNNAGYWRLGWAPTSLTNQSTTYFSGSLSNAVVFWSTTNPPTAGPTATNLNSQANFNSWSTSATERWALGDTGTTTYTGSQPTITTTSPCAYVDVTWSFTGPAATAVSGAKLSTFASGTAYPVGAVPDPGTSQSSSLTFARDSTYSTYVTGLRLLVPFTYLVQTATGKWPLTFSWSSEDSAVVAP